MQSACRKRLVAGLGFVVTNAMSAALRKPMTVEEFLAWEDQQELRYEFDGFQPVAMPGGTLVHSLIQANLIRQLGNRLAGGPWRAVGSDLKIAVSGSIRYPDVFVFCRDLPNRTLVVTQPVVVFEISSPGTAETDHNEKNREYRDTSSIQRYVMLEQDRMGVTVFARSGGDWVGHLSEGAVTLSMPEIGVELPLSEIYEGIAFAAPMPDGV